MAARAFARDVEFTVYIVSGIEVFTPEFLTSQAITHSHQRQSDKDQPHTYMGLTTMPMGKITNSLENLFTQKSSKTFLFSFTRSRL